MSEIQSQPNQELKIKFEIPLSYKNTETISGLAKWSKIVGIFHIILGIIYCLSIFLLMIPTVVMGIFFIFLGTRLTDASANLDYCIQNPTEETMMSALEYLRKYLFLNGLMFFVMLVFMIIIIAVLLFFGVAIFELFETMTDSYVSVLSFVF